ncbi:MAG: DUF5655 domain-containing protein [Holosporales bacterium]|jgi:hypothetical protein|nr:DUF5655 domain-containing protein [Holosporales bacterium]
MFYLYKNQNGRLEKLRETPFKLEKDVQKLFERNLKAITGLTLVKSEFTVKGRRIDTLAFDEQNKAFVIIEYKRDRNSSVVDQGFVYLNLMLENKGEFTTEYNERLEKKLKREDVGWSKTRVVFVSKSFTANQIEAANFKDSAIELLEVKRYENELIAVRLIEKQKSSPSVKPLLENDKNLKRIYSEIKSYTEEDHLIRKTEKIRKLYESFRGAILNLKEDTEIYPQKHYVAFKKNGNICDIIIQEKGLKIFINAKWNSINDFKKIGIIP